MDPKIARALNTLGARRTFEVQWETVRRAGEDGRGTYAIADLIEMLIEAKRFDEASALANEIATRDGEAPRGRLLLAEIAVAEGRTEEAMPLYEAFLADNPTECYQILDYLKILRDDGQLERIDAIVQACASGDGAGILKTHQRQQFAVNLYEQLDLDDRALNLLELLVVDTPNEQRLWNKMAGVLQKLGRWDEAEASYFEAIRLAPRDSTAHSDLSEMYLMDERWSDIVELLEPLVTGQASIDTDLGLSLARAQAATGSLKEAEAVLRRVVEADPKEYDAWFELGEVTQRRNRPAQALAAYRQFLELTDRYDSALGGECSCRCDVLDMRTEVRGLLPTLEAAAAAGG